MNTVSTKTNLALFWLLSTLFGAVTLWLWHNQFVSDEGIHLWSRLISVFDGEDFQLENLGVMYPHGRFYTLAPFHYLGTLNSPLSTTLVTVLFAAGILVLWNHQMTKSGYSVRLRMLMMLLIFIHPAYLWQATSGTLGTISLFCFYLLYVSTVKMIREQDIHAFIMVGVGLAIFYFADELTLYLFIALVPLLAMIVPRVILLSAPTSAYVILATPLLIAVAGWIYFNWIFYGSAFAFVNDPESGFLGSRHFIEQSTWLRVYGGQWLIPILIALATVVIAYPAIVLMLAQMRNNRTYFSAALVLLLHPVIAVGLATYDFYLRHPVEIVSLVMAGVMAEMTALKAVRESTKWAIVGLLLAGAIGGWIVFHYQPTPAMQQWSSALFGTVLPDNRQADIALGKWLDANRELTMVDDRSAYRAIVARGDAEKLVLPFSNPFKIEVRRAIPQIRQVALPNPSNGRGMGDAVNRRWPDFYEKGAQGYRLVYDRLGWRVWRRND